MAVRAVVNGEESSFLGKMWAVAGKTPQRFTVAGIEFFTHWVIRNWVIPPTFILMTTCAKELWLLAGEATRISSVWEMARRALTFHHRLVPRYRLCCLILQITMTDEAEFDLIRLQ